MGHLTEWERRNKPTSVWIRSHRNIWYRFLSRVPRQ